MKPFRKILYVNVRNYSWSSKHSNHIKLITCYRAVTRAWDLAHLELAMLAPRFRMLILKILWLLVEHLLPPPPVLALAWTNKTTCVNQDLHVRHVFTVHDPHELASIYHFQPNVLLKANINTIHALSSTPYSPGKEKEEMMLNNRIADCSGSNQSAALLSTLFFKKC